MGAVNVATWFRLSCQTSFAPAFQARQVAGAQRAQAATAPERIESARKSSGLKMF
jgi:hypothetical protein